MLDVTSGTPSFPAGPGAEQAPLPRAADGPALRHDRAVPTSPPHDEPAAAEACPGCGAVLARRSDDVGTHPGASPSCARLFAVTLRGLREDATTDAGAAAILRLADTAYEIQHPHGSTPRSTPPAGWTTTIADVAADLDVIDLGVLVESWARTTLADRTGPSRS